MTYQQDELSIPVNSVGKAGLLGAVELVAYYTQKTRAEELDSRLKQSWPIRSTIHIFEDAVGQR